MMIRPCWCQASLTIVAVAVTVLVSGCMRTAEGTQEDQRNPFYLTGKDRLQAMDYQGAVDSFERALQENPKSVLAHYELGLIHEQHLADYAEAIYHYNKAIKLRPAGYPADTILLRIPACRQELAKADSLAVTHPAVLRETDRLREENQELRKQVMDLKAALVARPAPAPAPATPALPVFGRGPAVGSATMAGGTNAGAASRSVAPGGAIGVAGAAPGSRPTAPGAVGADGYRVHIVLPQETLASISRAHNVRLEALLAANRGIDPKRLKVGQTIKVPVKTGQR